MHSPLPDSSALEAGIIEDATPTRLSHIQDSVRNLLRTSVFGSVLSSPAPSSKHSPKSPRERRFLGSPYSPTPRRQPTHPEEALPSPTDSSPGNTPSSSNIPGILFPPTVFDGAGLPVGHKSTVFNTRAVAALSHPDMTDPSLALFLQQKSQDRQDRAWKRSKSGSSRSSKSKSHRYDMQWVLCLLLGAVLFGLAGTYLALATTSSSVSLALHIVFVLGIVLTSIAFAHTLVRLCFFRRSTRRRRARDLPVSHAKRHRNRRHDRSHGSEEQSASADLEAHYVPPTPISVHVVSSEDEVRPDISEACPSVAVHQNPDVWDKQADVPNPPPAYGKWRGSVRADPALLHWHAVPSPTDPGLPSPTYHETAPDNHSRAPPSYRTRDSPARVKEVQEESGQTAQAQVAEPEMFEITRGRGFTL